MKFLDADGNEVAPNGTVSISFPVAAGYDSANLAVYRLADGGKVLVRGTVENGYYTVITKTAGTYALVEKAAPSRMRRIRRMWQTAITAIPTSRRPATAPTWRYMRCWLWPPRA